MHDNVGKAAPYQVLNLSGAIEFLGDEQAVSDLLQPLVTSLGKDIGEVERLLTLGDMPAIASTLHALKGFIPVFCHAEFAAQLVDVEKRIRGDHSAQMLAQVEALLHPLRQLVQESNRFLQQAGG
jgi:HPt (histidine-containing phosphotransfer) domain-containing protein